MLAAFASTAATAQQAATASGIDTQFIDPSVRAQDDFFTYLNGKWLKTVEIPSDKASWGTFMQLREETQPQLRALIEKDAADKKKKAGTDEQKIGDLYTSFMNEKSLEALGTKPLAAELNKIRTLKDKQGIPALAAHLAQIGVSTPYSIYIGQDQRASTKYAAYVGQSGLGMPDRDYYLKNDDKRMVDTRTKYQAHVAKILALAGEQDADAKAKDIVAFETALADVQWTKVENRDPVKRYNKVAIDKLGELTPGYDWNAALAAAGIAGKTDYVIVAQPTYLQGMNAILAKTDLATVKSYFEWQLLRAYSDYLSKDFVDADFAFYGTVLTGVTENRPRWKIGVSTVEGSIGEALGRQYVQSYFPAEKKARMQELVKNILAAYKESIDTLDWMSPATKKEAQAKLAKFTPKIAYPDKWRDYSALTIKPNDLVGNIMRARTYAYNRNKNKLGQPIDRSEWGMTPPTVNAYFNPQMNDINFPAGVLQPPLFDPKMDDAPNYGNTGGTIGHELTHAFDDEGRQFDANGNLKDWWTKKDAKAFEERAQCIVDQYAQYTVVDDIKINSKLTLGEDVADLGGLILGWMAWQTQMASMPQQAAPALRDGLTPEQRFFVGNAQWACENDRPENLRVKALTDPHSPGKFRVNGLVVNMPEFQKAFQCKAGQPMVAEKRCRVW